jgi:hypothetical protein
MGQLLNIDVPDLPDGYTPLEIAAVLKCLDEHGEVTLCVRTSNGIMAWEVVGMLIAASDMARADLQTDFSGGDTDEEDTDAAE